MSVYPVLKADIYNGYLEASKRARIEPLSKALFFARLFKLRPDLKSFKAADHNRYVVARAKLPPKPRKRRPLNYEQEDKCIRSIAGVIFPPANTKQAGKK